MEGNIGVQHQPKSKWKKYSLWSITMILVLLAAAFFIMYGFLSRSLPKTDGEIIIGSISKEVMVNRDDSGVPHILAGNERDLFIAQGYAQAQDRLFQMDLSRRQASGRLSEVIGEATVENDKYFRTLGLRRAAEASHEAYSPESI